MKQSRLEAFDHWCAKSKANRAVALAISLFLWVGIVAGFMTIAAVALRWLS